jgi:hypothetical protein
MLQSQNPGKIVFEAHREEKKDDEDERCRVAFWLSFEHLSLISLFNINQQSFFCITLFML